MLKIKTYRFWLIILLLVLAACQPESVSPGVCPIDETLGEHSDDCLPILSGDELSAEVQPGTGVDLALLIGEWRLSSYTKDGVTSNPPLKILNISADRNYTITTETAMTSGTWSSNIQAAETALVFDPGTDQAQQYQIIALSEAELNLRTWREDVQIDEGYQPADVFSRHQ